MAPNMFELLTLYPMYRCFFNGMSLLSIVIALAIEYDFPSLMKAIYIQPIILRYQYRIDN